MVKKLEASLTTEFTTLPSPTLRLAYCPLSHAYSGQGSGPGHMKVDTFGKRYLHTFHMAFKAKRTSAKVPRSIKESCCGNMAIRRL